MQRNKILLSILLYNIFLMAIAWRPFTIRFSSFECYPRSYLATYLNCSITQLRKNRQGLHANIKYGDTIDALKMHMTVYTSSSSNPDFLLLNVSNIDFCAIMETSSTNPAFRALMSGLYKYSDLPAKCPIPKGTELHVKDFIFDEHNFPPYVPDMNLSIRVQGDQRRVPCYDIRLNGTAKFKEGVRKIKG